MAGFERSQPVNVEAAIGGLGGGRLIKVMITLLEAVYILYIYKYMVHRQNV